jgi:SAM-dependent methyltransferase
LFFSKPSKALREAFRILKPNGSLVFSVWSKIGWYEDMKEALSLVEGAPRIPEEAQILLIHSRDPSFTSITTIETTLQSHGFVSEKVNEHSSSSILSLEQIHLMLPTVVDLLTRGWSDRDREAFTPDILSTSQDFLRQKYGESDIEWKWSALLALGHRPL